MISAADAALADRDPAVPLRLVLDDEALAAEIRARWTAGPPPCSVRVRYLRYKPGTLVEATVAVEFDDRVVLAALRVVAASAVAKVEKVLARTLDDGVDFAPVGDPLAGFVLLPLQADRGLPASRRLGRGRLLPELLAGASVVPLAYKPGRRLVARVDRDGVPWGVLRCHAPDRWPVAATAAGWAARIGAPPALPRLIGADEERCAMVVGWGPGTPADRVDAAGRPAADAAAGAAVAALHRLDPAGLVATPAEVGGHADDAAVRAGDVAPALAAIAALDPALAATVGSVARAGPHGRSSGSPRRVVHGDLSPDQVIVGEGGATLVDLDRLGPGDPAADLASWAAAVLAAGPPRGAALPATASGLLDATLGPAFLGAYRAAGGPATVDAVLGLLADAILARATDPFRLRVPGWDERLRELVAAHRVAAGA